MPLKQLLAALTVPFFVVLVSLVPAQATFAHVGNGGININQNVKSVSGQVPVNSSVAPRQTYVPQILKEKSMQAVKSIDKVSESEEIYYDDNYEYGTYSDPSSYEETETATVAVLPPRIPTTAIPELMVSSTTKNLTKTQRQLLSKIQQQSQLIQPQSIDNRHNWDNYRNNKQRTPVIKRADNEKDYEDEGSSEENDLERGDNGATSRNTRASSADVVDPEGYNYFKFVPYSSLGWLVGGGGPKNSHTKPQPATRNKGKPNSFLVNDTAIGNDDHDPADHYDWEFRRYDRACLYVENKKQKSEVPIPVVPEELKRIVDNQNELLAKKFFDWMFEQNENYETVALQEEGEQHPLFLTYKFLKLTMEIFRDKICWNTTSYAGASVASIRAGGVTRPFVPESIAGTKLLPATFVEEVFRLFLTFREITRPKHLPDYATKLDEEEIYKEVLEKCKDEGDSILWFRHSCGDQVLSNDQPNNFACTPLVDYDFNPKLYDPILDSFWHMFNAVHSYCFKYFQVNTRLWHRYAMIIANSYTVGMRQRWKASVAAQKFYLRLLGPDYEVHFETMNRCMFGTLSRSEVQAALPRFDTLSAITFGKERMIHKDGTAR